MGERRAYPRPMDYDEVHEGATEMQKKHGTAKPLAEAFMVDILRKNSWKNIPPEDPNRAAHEATEEKRKEYNLPNIVAPPNATAQPVAVTYYNKFINRVETIPKIQNNVELEPWERIAKTWGATPENERKVLLQYGADTFQKYADNWERMQKGIEKEKWSLRLNEADEGKYNFTDADKAAAAKVLSPAQMRFLDNIEEEKIKEPYNEKLNLFLKDKYKFTPEELKQLPNIFSKDQLKLMQGHIEKQRQYQMQDELTAYEADEIQLTPERKKEILKELGTAGERRLAGIESKKLDIQLDNFSDKYRDTYDAFRRLEFKTPEEFRGAMVQLRQGAREYSAMQKGVSSPNSFFGIRDFEHFLIGKEEDFQGRLNSERRRSLSGDTEKYLEARRAWMGDPSDSNNKKMMGLWNSLTPEHKQSFKESRGYDLQTPERFTSFRQQYAAQPEKPAAPINQRGLIRKPESAKPFPKGDSRVSSPRLHTGRAAPSPHYGVAYASRMTAGDYERARTFISKPTLRTLANLPRPILQMMYQRRPQLVDLAWNYGYARTFQQLASVASIMIDKLRQESQRKRTV